ncbi:hypothetical protein C4D60_Mb03t02670 [Musa balbisiana]|uniref:Uncharacterized protein n=1 Tax=Musa balbisiana TaxID=52838 RepID=A0A4S8J720_MUSBA|nr:hypothetical protein C4D60_Mb03t02670 [Musa balbisiana]
MSRSIDHLLCKLHTTFASEHLAAITLTIDHRPQDLLARVERRAVLPDLTLLASQHAQLAHLGHGVHKLAEEQGLVGGKAGDEGLGPGVAVQALVGGEEPLLVYEIDVVLVVEGVGRPDVVDGGVGGVFDRAGQVEILGEGQLQGGVLGGEEPVLEGGAVADTDGVAAGEGDEVGGVEVELGEGAAGRSVKLGGAFFSLGPPADPSNRIEPSQPCKHEPPTHTRARDLTVQLYDSIVHR